MTRDQIVGRINQKMYEGLYTFEDIKYDLDDAIIVINNTLNTKFPMISDKLTEPSSEYVYYDEEEEKDKPIFPDKYMNTVVVEFVVAALFRREGEFGNEFNTATGAHERAISAMFRDYFDQVPEEFIDDETGVMPINPYQVMPDE